MLISDIKQAFLKVSVKESDHDFLYDFYELASSDKINNDISSDKMEIIVCRFARVAFETTAS